MKIIIVNKIIIRKNRKINIREQQEKKIDEKNKKQNYKKNYKRKKQKPRQFIDTLQKKFEY